jgi:hypothetical protein
MDMDRNNIFQLLEDIEWSDVAIKQVLGVAGLKP